MNFMFKEKVFISASGRELDELRAFVCVCQRSTTDHNPLVEFNPMLDKIMQACFDAGRAYEVEHRK